jgi:hypothetical protein
MNNANRDSIQVTLSQDEALVLFEWLASLEQKPNEPPDEAEQRVIWRLEGQLESLLTVVVAADYRERVLLAKKAVLNEGQ